MSQLRIFVVETLGNGGMIHYAYQLCNGLAQQGADVTLITSRNYELRDQPHDFAVVELLDLWSMFDAKAGAAPSSQWAKVVGKVRWQLRRGWRALKLLRGWVQLTRYVVREQPDVVQFGKIQFPFETLFLWWMRRNGIVLSDICHEFEMRERSGNPLSGLVNRLFAGVYPLFSAIFFHAKQNRDRFVDLFGDVSAETHLIPHGRSLLFDEGSVSADTLRQRYGISAETAVVLFFGIVAPSKGVPDLIDSFEAVHQANPEAKLLIAGYPTKFIDMPALHERVEALGLEETVIFDSRYIPNEEVAGLFELASLVVFPYRNSTQSGALQVAYAHGKAVIATRCGGLPETVEEGKSGLLVEPYNPAKLGEAINLLLADDTLRDEFGRYALHLSQTRFSWPSIANEILSVYQSLVEPNTKPVAVR